MAFETFKEILDYKKDDWDRIEERATELWEFFNENLEINNWQVAIRGYGRMTFLEFMKKVKQQFKVGRYIEGSEAMYELLENMQNMIFDILKIRFTDIFRSLLHNLEEKKLMIETMSERIDNNDEAMKKVIAENDILKEENKRLRELIDFSNNGYYEMWKIIEVKFDNLMETYNDFEKIDDEETLKSYLEAMKIELQVGLKPIEAKKKYLIKEQLKNLGITADDFVVEDSITKEEIIEQEIKPKKENKKESGLIIDTSDFKKELDSVKEKEEEDYIVPKKEIQENKFIKYTTFKIHKDRNIYNEEDWINEDEPMTDEEREIRKNLIKEKFEGEDYMLESEVDYTDKSIENESKIITLAQLDLENTHINFGVDSKQWIDRYKEIYKKNLNLLEKKVNIDLPPTISKILLKLKNGKKSK